MTVRGYSKQKDGATYLETNFRVREFACNDGTDAILIDTTLTSILQMVRQRFKAAVTITSGYRTKAYNAQVGGAAASKHLTGHAADIVVTGITPLTVYNYLNTVMQGWGGLILYKSKKFVHVDTREGYYRDTVK